MSKYIIDAYAWIEYFEGTPSGMKVRETLLNKENEILTSAVTIAEVVSRIARKGLDSELAYTAIRALSRIILINQELSREVGLLHAHTRAKVPGFGLADAFVLQLAHTMEGIIVTGDPHFKGQGKVLFLK